MDIDDLNFETLEIIREGHVLEVVLDRPDGAGDRDVPHRRSPGSPFSARIQTCPEVSRTVTCEKTRRQAA